MNVNESVLWVKFQNGDTNALFTIYEMLHADLFKCGKHITSDDELVKDTINQFFLYLWDKKNNLNVPENLKSYTLVSFKRKLIAEISISKKTNPLSDFEPVPEPSYEDHLIEIQSQLELQLKVKNAMDKLPKRQRELITLKYYDELTFEEISQKTSLSIRTVYNKLHEATKFLRKEIIMAFIFCLEA